MNTTKSLTLFALLFVLVFNSCESSNSEYPVLYRAHTGTLSWGGSPEVDGSGLLFYTGNKTYGVPGDKSAFDHLFSPDTNQVDVRVDFLLTGEKTVRGWGTIYPEINIIQIERLPIGLK
ncbi:MAG: hypothetical protein HUJ22_01215 [Gracilimonas sp.]|uniref:hypothetical protein n=1 Tax=Gracilimonas sp. TaxID=1974203 RepID=UPI00198C2565|nr:hypothetical protein [Gracilimonas sp.]MBD3615161.1 hypothetical protein [Gracilimonas sp.]